MQTAVRNLLPWAPLVARILVGGTFIMAGWSKVTGYAGSVAFAQAVGLPSPEIAIVIAIAIEILGGLSILLGYRIMWGAGILAVFTLAVSLIFHSNFTDAMQQLLFTKNMGILAALLYMVRFGAGKLSIEE